jgi:HAD superfamily hydrolase (TIGR01509 family)
VVRTGSRQLKVLPALHIFDCDGVLVDSEVLVCQIESLLLRDIGVDLSPESIADAFVGLSDAEMHDRIEAEWGVMFPEDFAARKAARLAEVFCSELRAVPGIAGVLEAVHEPRCVASSSAPDRIRTSLAVTGLERFFGPNVFSASSVERGKPAPDLFLHAAGAMRVEPHRCVVIEDSPYGVAAGAAAGMRVVGFTGASHCSPTLTEQLREAGAHKIAPDAEALLVALLPAA